MLTSAKRQNDGARVSREKKVTSLSLWDSGRKMLASCNVCLYVCSLHVQTTYTNTYHSKCPFEFNARFGPNDDGHTGFELQIINSKSNSERTVGGRTVIHTNTH